ALVLKADGCVVSGLNITGGLPTGWSGEEVATAGLMIGSDDNEVFGCYFHGNYFGIYLKDAGSNWIHDSISVDNEQHGVFMSGASFNSFDNVLCNDNGYNGFGFFVSPDNGFFSCRAERNGVNGWEIWDSEREYVRFSTASGNGRMGFQIGGAYDTNSLINCWVTENSEDGIWISSDSRQTVENCTVGGNSKAGIRLSYNGLPTSAIVTGNLIFNNSRMAVEIDAGCDPSLIFGNDVIDNGKRSGKQASDNGTKSAWNNGMTGNHWSDWTFPDSNRDGIVDTPYTLAGTASARDDYPRTNRMTPHAYGPGMPPAPGEVYGPRITQSFLDDAVVGEPYLQTMDFVDRDTPEDLLNWSLDTDSPWLVIEGNVLSGIPGPEDVGTTYVTVLVSDGVYSDMQSYSLRIKQGSGGSPERPGTGMIDIGGHEGLRAGEVTLEARDLTEGSMEFIEYRWFVENNYQGMGATIRMELEEGSYDVILKAVTSEGEWYVVSRTVEVGPAPGRTESGGIWYIAVLIGAAVLGVLIAVAGWGFYTRRTGRKMVPHGTHSAEDHEDERRSAIPGTGSGNGLRFGGELPGPVRSGPLPEERRTDDILGNERRSDRGPDHEGPRISIDGELGEIEEEALSWKKVSTFTMDGRKMHDKLRMKYERGEIDDGSYEELAGLIDSYLPGEGT
ncbi:MAG: nitrous oxide reductase family maturation protein NosD, partial [Thermoplasmatota archaeon]